MCWRSFSVALVLSSEHTQFVRFAVLGSRAFHIMLSPGIKSIGRFYAADPRIMLDFMLGAILLYFSFAQRA